MRLTSLLVVLAGFGVAGASGYAAREMINDQVSAARAEQEAATLKVFVASVDIPYGHAIERGNITAIDWPRAAVPQGTFQSSETLLPAENGEPRRARRAIAQGELILASRVGDFGEKITIVQSLAPNHRAMSIKVDAESGVGGFVTPGDFVDVILTQGRAETLRTVTILQNVRVVGVDQDANEQNDQIQVARTVTLEVTPQDGQRLALAQEAGVLSLTLRNLTEEIVDEPLESVRLSDILQELSPVAEAAAPTITIRRAGVAADENL